MSSIKNSFPFNIQFDDEVSFYDMMTHFLLFLILMSLPYKFLHLTINHLAFFFTLKNIKFYMIIKYKLPNVVCNVDISNGSIPE